MFSAAVFAAGVMAAAVFVLVMGAMDVRVEGQLTGCKCCRSFVCATRNTAVQSNARLRKRSLCAAADAAADQRVDLMRGQEACKGTVAAAVRVDYLAVSDLAVLHIVQLELFGMAEKNMPLTVYHIL